MTTTRPRSPVLSWRRPRDALGTRSPARLRHRPAAVLEAVRGATSGRGAALDPAPAPQSAASLPDLGLVVTLYLSEADGHAGVFFGLSARAGADRTRLDPVADRVREQLEEQSYTPASFGHHGSIWPVDHRDERNWPAIAEWLVMKADGLEDAARRALGFRPADPDGASLSHAQPDRPPHRRVRRDREPRLRGGRGCRSSPDALRCHAASGAWAWS